MVKRKPLSNNRFNINLNIFKILSIVLIAILLVFTPTAIKKSIKISNIVCVSQFGECHKELVDSFVLATGRDYKIVKKYLEDILNNDSRVDSYLIQYRIPSTVKVEINSKKPKYSIYSRTNQKTYQIGEDGTLLSETSSSDLLKISVDGLETNLGEKISNEYLNASLIMEYLNFLFSIKEGEVQKNILKVQSNDGVSILIPLDNDINLMIGSLRLIFSRLNDGSEGIRMSDIREIDLRFKNPILRKR